MDFRPKMMYDYSVRGNNETRKEPIMRKVTIETIKAFLAYEKRTIGNTHSNGTELLLHGNRIAWHLPDDSIEVNMCGWGSVTTRERLNGLCRFLGIDGFFQKKGLQYFGGRRVSTTETIVLAEPGWVVLTIESEEFNG